jgi:hypothetical protein
MRENDIKNAFSRIKADDMLRAKVIHKIEENKRFKKTGIHAKRAFAAAAVAAAVVCSATAFAASPAGKQMIAYFQNDAAVEITSLAKLSEYNEAIGVSSTNLGYTLTLDNVAVDDNFMHVFYTLKYNDGKMFIEGAEGNNLWPECRMNGQFVGHGNHNEWEGYLFDDQTYKGVLKLNVASLDVPESFKLELYALPNGKVSEAFDPNYLYSDNLTLTDEDISKLIYVSTTAKKADVEAKNIVKNINKTFKTEYYDDNNNKKTGETEISKVIFSPFGNQLVVTDTCEGCGAMQLAGWAMFDENGQSLDILNTDLSGSLSGQKSTNALEFLKADANTKQLKLVPIHYGPTDDWQVEVLKQDIGAYPMTFKVNDYGSIVVTDVRISDGEINIDYYKDGFSSYDPHFQLFDKNGNNAEPGGKLGCTLYTRVHHDTNSYTAQYKYDAYDENGNKLPLTEKVTKEGIEKSFTTLGVYTDQPFSLDYNNALEIDLK